MDTREKFMYVLGGVVVVGVITFTAALIFFSIPENNKEMVNIALGAFIGAFLTVVGYFYGSSKGSSDKTQLLTKKE